VDKRIRRLQAAADAPQAGDIRTTLKSSNSDLSTVAPSVAGPKARRTDRNRQRQEALSPNSSLNRLRENGFSKKQEDLNRRFQDGGRLDIGFRRTS